MFKYTSLYLSPAVLDNTHSLRRADSEDFKLYSRDPIMSIIRDDKHQGSSPFDLIFEVEVGVLKTGEGIDSDVIDQEAYKALLALRLFNTGPIGIESLFMRPNVHYPFLPVIERYGSYEGYGLSKYKLEASDNENLKVFWHEFQELYPIIEKSLAVPKDRFMSSYSQWQPLNRVLDIVIGLESIFSESSESISYKYALRGAVATGRTIEERVKLQENLKLAYKMRSSVAHGAKDLDKKVKRILDEPNRADEFIEELRQVLARAILVVAKWQKANPGKSDFIKELDEAMLKTQAFRNDYWQD